MVNPVPPEDSLIAILDETELLVATALAVCDGLLPQADLASVVHQSVEGVAAALAVLRDLGLVNERSDGSVVIGHALLGARLQAACPPEDKQRIHSAVAEVFDRNGADAAFVLDHLEASGDRGSALRGIQLCLARCRACLLVGEVVDAATFLDRADRFIRIALS